MRLRIRSSSSAHQTWESPLLLLAFFVESAELGGVEQQELIEIDPLLLGAAGPSQQLSDTMLLLLDRPLLSDGRLLETGDGGRLLLEACSLGFATRRRRTQIFLASSEFPRPLVGSGLAPRSGELPDRIRQNDAPRKLSKGSR